MRFIKAAAKNQEQDMDLILAEKIINKACKKIGYARKSLSGKIRSFLLCLLITIIVTMVMAVAALYCIMWICVNGPSDRARYLFVTSVKESSAGGFLANIFVPDIEIDYILHSGETPDINENTDSSLIKIPELDDNNVSGELDNNDEAKDTQSIEIVDVTGPTYRGKMAIIRDPKKVILGVSGAYGPEYSGKTIKGIVESYDGVLGINASGFEDINGSGNGGTPIGIVISQGKLLYGEAGVTYELIGIDNNNVMIVDNMTPEQAVERGIRDAVSFGPVLVKNGKPVYKNGGMNPRSAIGQRSDGAILLLVIEGRQVASIGATMRDMTNIMLDFGAVNAANLDGGSSSSLYADGEYVIEGSYVFGVRKIPNGFVVLK